MRNRVHEWGFVEYRLNDPGITNSKGFSYFNFPWRSVNNCGPHGESGITTDCSSEGYSMECTCPPHECVCPNSYGRCNEIGEGS